MKDQAMTTPDDRAPYVSGQPSPYTSTPAYRIDASEDLPVGDEPDAPEQRPRARRWVKVSLIAAIVIVGLAIFGFGYFVTGSPASSLITPPLVKAQQACDPTGLGTTVADGKKTLVINGAGKEDTSGVPVEGEACILRELGVTAAVLEHMTSTRALDGRQTDAWGGFKAAWTYHPDQGLDLVIQDS